MLIPNKTTPFERSIIALSTRILSIREKNPTISTEKLQAAINASLHREIHIDELIKAEVFLYIIGKEGKSNAD